MKNLHIGFKLLASFTVLVVLAAVIGLSGIMDVNRIWQYTEDMFDHPLQVSNTVRDIQMHITSIHRSMKDVILSDSLEELEVLQEGIAMEEQSVFEEFDILFDKFLGERMQIQIAYDAFIAWEPIRSEVIQLYMDGDSDAAAAITKGRGAQHVDYMTRAMNAMSDFATGKALEFYNGAHDIRERLLMTMLILIAATGVCAAIVVVFVFRTIIKPIRDMAADLQEVMDINEKQARELIELGEQRFNITVRHAPLPAMVHADDGEVLLINTAWTETSGYTHDDIPNLDAWVELAYKDGRQEMKKYVNSLFSAILPQENTDVMIYCKDGSTRYWNFRSSPLGEDSEGRKMLLSMAVDITREKNDAAKLASEREKLAVTLRSIGDGVISTDTCGIVQMVNRAAEELTGWKQEEAVGKPLAEVFHIINEDTRVRHYDPVKKAIRTGSSIELENHTILMSKDGHQKVIADSAAPIRDMQSNIIGAVLVFRDETEHRALQRQIQRNEKLESLGVLAGGVAHDFNNLLGGMFGFIELARDVNSEHEVDEYLSQASSAFDRAKGITDQLMTFAKGGEPVRKNINIDSIVRSNASFILSGTNIALTVRIEEGLWSCMADSTQIGRVIDNLVLNASQSMPNGGTVSISVFNGRVREDSVRKGRKKTGEYITIEIVDTGVGMTRETMDRIFDPFFSTKDTGHGLGLATCYSIIQRHNGYIDVTSVPGQGSTFSIYLPRAEEGAGLDATPRKEASGRSGAGTVLIMDDEPVIRGVVKGMLGGLGYAVLETYDSESALTAALQHRETGGDLKAALLDLTIPGGPGGNDVREKLKAIYPGCIMIAASGYSNSPVIARPTAFGFDGSIHKPFRLQELSDLLDRYQL